MIALVPGGRRTVSPLRRPRRSPSRFLPGFDVSAGVIDFTEAPFCEVTYAYLSRPPARVLLHGLPEPMRHELAWWLCSLHSGGERVNSWIVGAWVKVAAALAADPGRAADSFACLSVESGCTPRAGSSMTAGAACQAERLSTPTGRRSRAFAPRLSAPIDAGEWWHGDVWEPRRDPRIPVREHEPLGNARLRFAAIEQPWLREAIKWFFACALEQGLLAWSTLPGYRTYLGGYFSEFLLQAGIDDPRLADNESELRAVALRLLSYLRGRRSRRSGGPLSRTSVGLAQSALSRFYLFMADYRHEAARALGEPRWSELSDAHARLWRSGRVRWSRPAPRTGRLHRSRGTWPDRRVTWTSLRWRAIRPRPWSSTASGAKSQAAAIRRRCGRSCSRC